MVKWSIGLLLGFLAHASINSEPALSATAKDNLAELYGAGRATSSVEISPDGTHLAYLSTQDGVNGLVVRPVDGQGGFRMPSPEIKLRSVEWSGPNHVLLRASETTVNRGFSSPLIEFNGVFSVDIRSREMVQLLSRNRNLGLQSSLSNVRAKKWDEDGTVLMAARTSSTGRQDAAVAAIGGRRGNIDLYEVDGNTGRGKRISKGAQNTDQWVVRPNGTIIARVDYYNKSNSYRILAPEEGVLGRDWDTIYSEENEIPSMTVWGTDGSGESLIISTYENTGRRALFEMSASDGTISPTALYEHEFVDVNSIIVDDYTGEVVGVDIVYAAREQQFFQSDFVAVINAVTKALPDGYRVYLESWDQKRERFVLFAQSATDTGMYLMLDISKGSLDVVARPYPDVTAEHLSEVTPFAYKTRDNVRMQGYLTLPNGAEDKNLPLVVMPHGGPEARDELGYDWWQQFLASRGYAVLQMNFRGSSGYGANFIVAGYGEWGRAMQDDITDAVAYLVEEDIADPDNICIVGASYGGYAALAGAAFTPDLYKCAVSYSGIADLNRMLNWERKRYGAKSSTYEYWQWQIGEDRREVDARSPINAVDQITADILLIHGKDDTVVAVEQSDVMAKALKKAGKPHEYIELDGEDHWLSSEETRVTMLKEVDAFLAKHLGEAAAERRLAAAK